MSKLDVYLFPLIQHGFCWGKTPFPTVEKDAKNLLGVVYLFNAVNGTRQMTADISGLETDVTYYIRPYFTNMFGTFYGEAIYREAVITDIEMVFVQGGTFTMGCTAEQGSDCYDWEKPAHKVTLSDFYIGKYEVTQAQWEAIMGSNPSEFIGCENCPVETVSWDDVQDFIQKLNAKTGLNYRLPTEAEWEYAARGGAQSRGYKYSGSNSVDEVAWFSDNSGDKTHPVGTKKANELGIYDMSGNVFEWCGDYIGAYSSEAQTNPKGPSSGSERVLRGGCWGGRGSLSQYVRVPNRFSDLATKSWSISGFRLVRSSN
jgi:formylglycine-generating enzyme required for sulfatase activity